MENVKILLVGVGGYGSNYIKELTEKNVSGVQIEGICEVMKGIEELYPEITARQIPVYTTLEAFYREHQADLAVISTPIHLHYAQTEICLKNGSHVLIEKPVCTSVEGAKKLLELEKETGHFIAVGYQLNYSRDVLALKQDILDGVFGKPIYMKALHAMKRGMAYYHRNNWAGRIQVNGCAVNDSPFNNACAHQFQNMTFLLGSEMGKAAELMDVQAELYRANPNVENFDTAAVRAQTEAGTPLWYFTSHALKEKSLGPICEYRFEKATIWFGKDFGQGEIKEYVAEFDDGTRKNYGEISKGERLQKLYDAIEAVRNANHPVCTVQCAIPHLEAVNQMAKMPIHPVKQKMIRMIQENGDEFYQISNLKEVFETSYQTQRFPSEVEAGWV